MLLSSKFFVLIGLASCCSSCPGSDEQKRYTCAHALCLEKPTWSETGNRICSINYDSLQSAQYYCHMYKCDKIIQYEFNGSDKFEILKESCTENFCTDSLGKFQQIEPNHEPSAEVKYLCPNSPCVTQTYQPNGNQYCITNFFQLQLAKIECRAHDCDYIIRYTHNNQYMYEILKAVYDSDENVEGCGAATTKDDIEFLSAKNFENVVNFQSEVEIRGHSSHPFKQYTTHYINENITEITVEAHNDFEQNTFFLLPEYQLRAAVIGNHTCIFSDIHAYDFDQLPQKQSQLNFADGLATPENIIEIHVQSSYKPSDIKIDFLPRRVVERCENKKMLEVEYIRLGDATDNETFNIAYEPLELPIGEKNRLTRSSPKKCPLDHCGPKSLIPELRMMAKCSTRDCPKNGKLPSCMYLVGAIQGAYQQYLHLTDNSMSCMPCCYEQAIHQKMPVCKKLMYEADVCEWYWKNGRCPDFVPGW